MKLKKIDKDKGRGFEFEEMKNPKIFDSASKNENPIGSPPNTKFCNQLCLGSFLEF